MTLVNETPRRESEVRRPKVKGHTGGKSGKPRQRGSEARFHREAEGLQVWGKGVGQEFQEVGVMGELSEARGAGVPQVRRWGSGGPGASHLHEIALKDGQVPQLVELPAL